MLAKFDFEPPRWPILNPRRRKENGFIFFYKVLIMCTLNKIYGNCAVFLFFVQKYFLVYLLRPIGRSRKERVGTKMNLVLLCLVFFYFLQKVKKHQTQHFCYTPKIVPDALLNIFQRKM